MPVGLFPKKDQQQNTQNAPPQPPSTLNLGTVKFKTSAITHDYQISSVTLGVGINGKVVECYDKKKGGKYALKVSIIPFQLVLHSK